MTHKEREKVVIVSRALDIAAELFAAEKYCLFDDEGKCRKQEKTRSFAESAFAVGRFSPLWWMP